MQRDSVSRAFERRMAFSSMRERMTSASVGLSVVSIDHGRRNVCASLPADLECWRGHGRELCDYLEDTIKLALRQWCRHIYRYARNDSGYSQ